MIKLKNLTKKYGDNVILEEASYDLPQKGLVCLLGASGGGKTTLLNLLAGFDTDYEGEISVGGTSLHSMDADALCAYRRDNIGFVFQNYCLLPGYTVLENLLLAAELTEEAPEKSLQRAKALLSRLGIGEKENQQVENLSGGQKQRVAIARALMGDPQILLADEPTGALDRASSTEIMELLREISRERPVLVITHDQKIRDFGDEILRISDRKIQAERKAPRENESETPLKTRRPGKPKLFARGLKNFKVHKNRYIAASLAISIGVLAFLFSLSFGNVMERSIDGFRQKNTAFNNGYIKGADEGKIFELLQGDERIENLYYQYKLTDVRLSLGNKQETISEKYPLPKACEELSYGVMPRRGQEEISLSPSLAKKFDSDIKNLLGKKLTLELNGEKHELSVSGIFNAGYDDFFLSSDLEQQLYENLPKSENYSISYDVKDFSDIVAVSNDLKLGGVDSKNAAAQVFALQSTFDSLNKLFLVISLLILAIGLFICAVLLVKLQNTRYRELGLLSALGFGRKQISTMLLAENLLLSVLATGVNLVLLGGAAGLCCLLDLPFTINGGQIVLSLVATFGVILIMSAGAGYRVLRRPPV
ncbi:MAG: ABC transporter ATP-binding protein/permease [Oscillospiraceae bacterium]